MTVLMIAAGNGHAKTVEVLIEAGADVDAKDRDGRTALFGAASGVFATEGKGHAEIVRALVAAGFFPNDWEFSINRSRALLLLPNFARASLSLVTKSRSKICFGLFIPGIGRPT